MNRIALHAASPGYEPEALDAWSRLSEVHCPVLVVVGDLDLLHIRARAEELAARIAGARLRGDGGGRPSPGLRAARRLRRPAARLPGPAGPPADPTGPGGRHEERQLRRQ